MNVFFDFAMSGRHTSNVGTKDCLAFTHLFINIPCQYELPVVKNYNRDEDEKQSYEDFLAIQTHNSHNIKYV